VNVPKPNVPSAEVLDALFAVIDGRRDADPTSSYTARLFAKGAPKIAQKVGEEATETIIAALAETHDDLVYESADLLYHLLVLWAAKGVNPADVYAELERRRTKQTTTE
jgi:phosphoribosyl-ATP pyrophosphohydrolase